jgi:pSer/pThr/pTyr-binding forkhead associated (FHA) protein
MVLNSIRTPKSSGSGVFPALVLVQGNEQKNIVLNRTPFSVGRKIDKDLVIADPRVSRDHALIVSENGKYYVVDQGSKHGTFVNGERIERKGLERNDRLEFGIREVVLCRVPSGSTPNLEFGPRLSQSNFRHPHIRRVERP